jgi:hypothetical protein
MRKKCVKLIKIRHMFLNADLLPEAKPASFEEVVLYELLFGFSSIRIVQMK